MKTTKHNLCWKMMIIFIFLMSLPHTFSLAAEPQGRLLVINSYSEGATWSQNQIKSALLLVSQLKKVDLEIIHMDGIGISDKYTYQRVEDGIFESCKEYKPDWLLLIGNMAFNMRDRIKREWGDIPILLITDVDLYAPLEYFFSVPDAEFGSECIKPLSELQGEYNFTLIKTQIKYKETIDMMVRMLPGMKTLVFAADKFYVNRRLDRDIRSYISSRHPHLKYERVIASEDNKHRLHQYLWGNETDHGVLFSTWYYERKNVLGVSYISTEECRLAASSSYPMFALRSSYLEIDGFVGGYYQDSEEVGTQVYDRLSQMLYGKEAREIPFYHCKSYHPYVNYGQLALKKISKADCPSDTIFVNKPLAIWEQYPYWIIVGGGIFIALLIVAISKYRFQRKKIALLNVHDELIKNMPILYLQGKVIFDANHKVTDVKYISGNIAFDDKFTQKCESEDIPTEFLSVLQIDSMFGVVEEVLKKRCTMPYVSKNKTTGPFYDFIISPSVEKNVVDIFGINVTTQYETEQELVVARNKAEESERLKSAFLANMSHEIRTPLNAIVGFSDLLTETDDIQTKAEFAKIIKSNNELLLQLINDILDLAKIDACTLEFNYSDVNLNELMENIKSTINDRLSPGVVLNVAFGAAHCHINTEYNRLSQVLINLLTNACKFTKHGSITFGYRLEEKDIYFYVHDTGCGIPKDKLDQIFSRFTKLNTFVQGTGLGLSICQDIIQRMNGEIGADSNGENKGSTFWFTIPYLPVDDEIEEAEDANEEEVVTIGKRKSILIAEDSENNYELFEAILKHDYDLIHAWDGVEAVDLFLKKQPDIIIMDITMPRMDGYEATKKIREHSATVPILAVTACAFVSDRERVLQNGFDGYMAKPITSKKLIAEIRKMMK